MGSIRVTFALDEETAKILAAAAARLGQPRSCIVRDAIRDHAARLDRAKGAKPRNLLTLFDELVALRRARHGGGHRPPTAAE